MLKGEVTKIKKGATVEILHNLIFFGEIFNTLEYYNRFKFNNDLSFTYYNSVYLPLDRNFPLQISSKTFPI